MDSQALDRSYSLTQIDNPDYLHFRLEGVWSEETSNMVVREIAGIVDSSEHSHVLLDCSHQVVQTSLSFDFLSVKSLVSTRFGRLAGIALVESSEDKERSEFLELVARNRYMNLRVFCSEADAKSWILEGSV